MGGESDVHTGDVGIEDGQRLSWTGDSGGSTATGRGRGLDGRRLLKPASGHGRERLSGGRCKEELHQITSMIASGLPKEGGGTRCKRKALASGQACCGSGDCWG